MASVAALPEAQPHTEPPAHSEPFPYHVNVEASSQGVKSELLAGEHTITIDAGQALGGQDSAPSPVQAFLSSIVACSQVGRNWRWCSISLVSL
jgi:hypothetical protein